MPLTRIQNILAGIVAAVLLAALPFYVLFSANSSVSNSQDNKAGPGEHTNNGMRGTGPTELRVVLLEPKPNSEHQLGEEIHLKGYLEVPEGQTLFEQEVYVQNLTSVRGSSATLFSCLVPFQRVDGHDSFETTLQATKGLPNKPGRYEIKVTAPSLLEDDSSSHVAKKDKTTGHRPESHSATATVRYKVVRRSPP
jgi:hypothetical protein